MVHRIPCCEETDGHHGEEDDDDVPWMDADGIGVDDEGALRLSQGDDAVRLLQPAEQQTNEDADDGADDGDEPNLPLRFCLVLQQYFRPV